MQDDEARKITKQSHSQRNNTSIPLTGFWYSAVLSTKIKRGTMKAQTLLGMPLVICRDLQGGVAAFLDLCPHRAMPLSFGCFDGRRIECSYHGWQFDMTGACKHIPALVKGAALDPEKVGVTTYPLSRSRRLCLGICAE